MFPYSYSHPYEYELQHWSPAPSQLTLVKPVGPKSLNETPLTIVTTEEQLSDMVQKLKTCTEFAFDLEVTYYSFLSFGYTNYISYYFWCKVN